MDTPPANREKHLDFLKINWESLAALAYGGYLTKGGRGMLIIDDGAFINKPRGQFTKFSAVYVAENSPEFATLGGKWPGDKEACWVREYDPATTVLFGFSRSDDGGESSYRIEGRGDGVPVLCYARSQGVNN